MSTPEESKLNNPTPSPVESGTSVDNVETQGKENVEDIVNQIDYAEKRREEFAKEIKQGKEKLARAQEKLKSLLIKKESPEEILKRRRLEKFEAEQKATKKLKKILLDKQEKEHLIQKEKEIILQAMLDKLFEEFKKIPPQDLKNLAEKGQTSNKQDGFYSQSMGYLNPEIAQPLAKAFLQGIKLVPKIIEAFPELLKNFDQDLTKEARNRVEEKLRETGAQEPARPTPPHATTSRPTS